MSTKVSVRLRRAREVDAHLSRTACELVRRIVEVVRRPVEVGIGGWGVVGTPKTALVPDSVIRFMLFDSTSFFDQPSALSPVPAADDVTSGRPGSAPCRR